MNLILNDGLLFWTHGVTCSGAIISANGRRLDLEPFSLVQGSSSGKPNDEASIRSTKRKEIAVPPTTFIALAAPPAILNTSAYLSFSVIAAPQAIFSPAAVPGTSRYEFDTARWAKVVFAGAKLGDARRTKRLIKVVTQIASMPNTSLPDQIENRYDLKAAYRLFDCDEVTFQAVASPHWQNTREKATKGRFLILSDTTEMDFGGLRKTVGLGPVGSGSGKGFMIHSGLMVDASDGSVIGLAGAQLFHRIPAPKGETRAQRRKRDRESEVWRKLIDQTGRPLGQAQWIYVMDRGADNYEVFVQAQRSGVDWIIRGKSFNRLVMSATEGVAKGERNLAGVLSKLLKKGQYSLPVRTRPDQPARIAEIQVTFAPVTLMPPKLPADSLKAMAPEPIAQWVVCARELNPPEWVKEPISWVLLTSLPVENMEDAMDVIHCYTRRWIIEEWHKCIKSGCQLEKRQFRTSSRLEAVAGVLTIVALRLLQLRDLSRREADHPAKEFIDLRYLEMMRRQRCRPTQRPEDEWTIRKFFRFVAELGGFTGGGNPGWITLMRGWGKLNLMMRGACTMASFGKH